MAPDEAIKEADEATREAEAGPEETLEAELSAELVDLVGQQYAAEGAEQQAAAAAAAAARWRYVAAAAASYIAYIEAKA